MSEERCRSVNDFDTPEGLKAALQSQEYLAAYSDIARDFPLSLVGSSVGNEKDDDARSEATFSIGDEDTGDELDWILTNYDAEISQTQSLSEELRRLQCLKSYLILDSEREASFERLTALAGRIFSVPIALVSLVDLGRQWFMSNRGLGEARETPRKFAFCAHVILSNEDVLVVPDAPQDHRFSGNPLVTGPPNIRFYAGAPLMSPEGYKLGTFCIIDSKPRPAGLSLEEKQNLRELAALAMDAMVLRKQETLSVLQDKSQIIACTAHDLLTPLSGVQMSLSLLLEDEELLQRKLSPQQKELIATATSCTNVMNRICQHAIGSFRETVAHKHNLTGKETTSPSKRHGHVNISEMVQNLQMVMEPYPKSVPLYITVDPTVPPVILGNDLKIFRAALNLLTNACKKTKRGSVQLKLYVASNKRGRKPKLILECEDTGPGVPLEHYEYLFRPFRSQEADKEETCMKVDSDGKVSGCQTMHNSGLGLYSVATQITSIGGEYGFRPRASESGAIFWFSIPLKVPHGHPKNGINSNGDTSVIKKTTKLSLQDTPEARQAQKVQLTLEAETLTQKIHDLGEAFEQFSTRTHDSTHDSNPPVVTQTAKNADTVDMVEEETTATTTTTPQQPRRRRALVIDDSLVIRKCIGRALSKLGFDVVTATNGLEGLKELQATVFDVAFCDYLMPVMDGLDCVQQYRDWEALHRPWIHQYVVGISAHASPNDVEKGFEAGMDDFRSKPITLQVLKELDASPKLKQVSDVLDKVDSLVVEESDEAMKRLKDDKRTQVDKEHVEGGGTGPACLIGECASSISKIMVELVEARHWNPVVVHDGEDALRLLKMRNWHAVLLDEELPRLDGIRCVARFREWESEHRVARQKNVFLLSESLVPNPSEAQVSATYPAGFDGALGKPILPSDMIKLLDETGRRITSHADSSDIVTR